MWVATSSNALHQHSNRLQTRYKTEERNHYFMYTIKLKQSKQQKRKIYINKWTHTHTCTEQWRLPHKRRTKPNHSEAIQHNTVEQHKWEEGRAGQIMGRQRDHKCLKAQAGLTRLLTQLDVMAFCPPTHYSYPLFLPNVPPFIYCNITIWTEISK